MDRHRLAGGLAAIGAAAGAGSVSRTDQPWSRASAPAGGGVVVLLGQDRAAVALGEGAGGDQVERLVGQLEDAG